MVGFGDAHQVADDLQGEGTGQIGDDLALAVGMVLHHRGHQAAGPVAHRILEEGQHARGERAADDVAQPGVPRIVHRDHRPEVLGQLGGLVADRDPTRRAEDLGMPAGVEHVVVAGHRPVAGSRGELLADERLVERHRSLSAQGGERAVTYVVVEAPEVPRREVDVGQRNLGRGGAVHPGRDTHVASLRVSFVAGPALGPSLVLHLGLEHVPRALAATPHAPIARVRGRSTSRRRRTPRRPGTSTARRAHCGRPGRTPADRRAPRAPRRAACRTLRPAAGRHGP